jgi:isocitrate/isopropylmalate dehydrogenase
MIRGYPELSHEHSYVDDGARRIVRFPQAMDVVLTMNLYGDILSDLGGEVAGGLGLAPSACIGDHRGVFRIGAWLGARHRRPRHREPDRHAALGGADMLEHVGLPAEAERLESAVAHVSPAQRPHPRSWRQVRDARVLRGGAVGARMSGPSLSGPPSPPCRSSLPASCGPPTVAAREPSTAQAAGSAGGVDGPTTLVPIRSTSNPTRGLTSNPGPRGERRLRT